MPSMDSYPWNTGAVVIVNDMVESAAMGTNPNNVENDINGSNDKIGMDGRNGTNEYRFPELLKSLCKCQPVDFFVGHSAYKHKRVSCTRRRVTTEHLTGRSTHAYFSRCAPCGTVFHMYTSSTTLALAQDLMKSAGESCVENRLLHRHSSHDLSQPRGLA